MAITIKAYGQGILKTVTGTIDWDTDTFKLLLFTNADAPVQDTDDFRDDITSELSTASGYTAGGVTLSSVTVTYDSASDQIRFDSADPSWTFTAGVTWRYGAIYKSRGGLASADELLFYLDWGSDQTVSTAYTIVVDSTGWYAIDVT